LLASATGCAQLDVTQPKTWFSREDGEPQTPKKVVAVWTDAEAQHVDHRRTRGFGGRLTFFDPEGDAPVRVDGKLVVYAFDEDGRDAEDVKPSRKYVFTPEQFANHHSQSKLGHSYSVWLPWDEVGGPQKQISLICRFEPTDGPPILAEQTKMTLPGPAPPALAKDAEPASYIERVGASTARVLPVSHHAAIPDDAPESPEKGPTKVRMKTTTIPISSRFGRTMPVAQTNARASRALAAAGERRWNEGSSVGGTATGSPARPTETGTLVTRLPSVDSQPGAPPVPAGQSARQASDRAPWQPSPAASRFPSRSLPPWATVPGASSTSPAARPTASQAAPAQAGSY
jgi:hypothetical protein